MLSSTYNKVLYSILQNELTKSFNNYVTSYKHEYVKNRSLFICHIWFEHKKTAAQWFETLQAV